MLRRCPRCHATAPAGAFAVVAPPRLGWAGSLLRRQCPRCGHVARETRGFPRAQKATGGTATW
jgi:hypothetical protein